MEFDVYGRRVIVERRGVDWAVFLPAVDGKRRKAEIVIPSDLPEGEIASYLADLYHEHGSPEHSEVRRLK